MYSTAQIVRLPIALTTAQATVDGVKVIAVSDDAQSYLLIDRASFRDPSQPTKNIRNRYQVVSADQSLCVVFRGLAAAKACLADLAAGGSWAIATLGGSVIV